MIDITKTYNKKERELINEYLMLSKPAFFRKRMNRRGRRQWKRLVEASTKRFMEFMKPMDYREMFGSNCLVDFSSITLCNYINKALPLNEGTEVSVKTRSVSTDVLP